MRRSSWRHDCQPSWTSTLKPVFCGGFGFSKYDKHRKDGLVFIGSRRTRNCNEVGWVLLRKLRLQSMPGNYMKICRKKYNGEQMCLRQRKHCKRQKKKQKKKTRKTKLPTNVLKESQCRLQHLTKRMRAKRGTFATAVRAVVRPWANILFALDIFETIDAALSLICHESRRALRTSIDTFVFNTRKAAGHKSKFGLLFAFTRQL